MPTYRTCAFAAAFLAGAAPNTALAGAEAIVITATKIPTPLREIGSAVSVITQDELERQGAAFGVDALRTLPGVSVSENGGPGGVASVRIRGEEAYRTLVLIDGIRVSDAAAPQVAANPTNVLASDIGRIEVVRGPQSLLYGADAVGGVVHILTPDPQPGFAFGGQASAGSYGTKTLQSMLLYGGERARLFIQGSAYDSAGFSAKEGDPALSDPDGLEAYAVHGKADIDLGGGFWLRGVGRYALSDAEFDGAGASIFGPADPDRLMKTRESAGRFELHHEADQGRIKTSAAFTLSDTRRDDLSNGLPFAFGSQFDGTRARFELASTFALAHGAILAGLDSETLSVETDAGKDRTQGHGLYAEWQNSFGGHLFTTIGARYDDGEDFGSHVSGRATAAFLFGFFANETSRFHTSFGTGFRAPSLFEQAANRAASLPLLHGEESRGFDAGFEQSLFGQSVLIDATYFDQSITDEIRFDNVGFTGYFQSTGISSSKGLETSLHAEQKLAAAWIDALQLDLAYTYTDARVHSPDPENGLPRVRRPRHMGNASLSLIFLEGRGDLTASIRTSAEAQDGFREFRVPLDDHAVVNLAARWRVAPGAELFVTGANVTNEQYEEIAGFATSDAAVYAGIRLKP